MNFCLRSPWCRLVRCAAGVALLFLICAASCFAADTFARQIFQDTLLPGAARPAGAAIQGTALTEGGVKWSANEGVTIGDKGATASTVGGAHHPIDAPMAGTIHLHATVDARGSGFAGIALGRGDLSGNFWANLSLLLFVSGDRYNLLVEAKDVIARVDKSIVHSEGPNQLDLTVDTAHRTLTAKINDKTVLSDFALPTSVHLADITAAGFRFNEPVTTGKPTVRDYRAEIVGGGRINLEPIDVGTFFVVPGKETTLRWRVGESKTNAPTAPATYVVRDYEGRPTGSGTGVLSPDKRTLTVTATFPRGYSEVYFPNADRTFGVVALEPHAGPADPFFCMDSALSGLEPNADRRASLIGALARSGIALSRERIGLPPVAAPQGATDWEGERQYDTIRKTYAENKVPTLEILDGNTDDLPQLASVFAQAARHWSVWGAVEASNEPDLKAMPADQYVPLVKTLRYALNEAGSQAPLVSGVFASLPPGPFYDACLSSGMLDDSDAVSFHSYDRAPDVEGIVTRYRAWLKKGGKEAMPLWHTECGWSWVLGPARPPQGQDAASALEISAKAVESMACGVARYFPFVYVYYEEGQKNFGMMGRDATPLRSMAAYAACVQALSGKEYLGDVTGLDGSVKLARVFGRAGDAECVAVLYTGAAMVAPNAAIPFPVKPTRVTGADGRTLAADGNNVPISDGLAYVWFKRADLGGELNSQTRAMGLYRIGRHPLTPLASARNASPIVFQFLSRQTPSRASARGYLVSQESAHKLALNIRVSNLSASPVVVHPELTLPGESAHKVVPITVPAKGHSDVVWTLDAAAGLDIAQVRYATVTGKTESGMPPSPLAIPLVMDGTLEQHLARHKRHLALPITDLGRWSANIAAHGRSTFSATPDGIWRMGVTYTGNGGNWAYPKFDLPAKIDTSAYSGFLIRARVLHEAGGVAIIAEPGSGSPTFWVTDLFPPDGEWHTVYVPFGEFKVGPGGTGDQNTRLDSAAWKKIDLGMGSNTPENTLEVSHLLLVGGDDD